VPADRVLGRVVYSVPYVGRLAEKLHTKTAFFALLVLPTALIIATELRELGRGIADLRRGRAQKEKTGEGLGTAT
jgi:hypothetical protein